ncbi:hypothetical protein ARMA_3071 [Ardenticatena maritima]|uniref:Uncharacterized protein n=1 Tax=Ardenticatena maritima TaxID=872965 RepID=A0A0M9UE22_9CHLR|nr:hypothetical protein ARMA_3071 [Ardenticatena maritima]
MSGKDAGGTQKPPVQAAFVNPSNDTLYFWIIAFPRILPYYGNT